MLQSMESQRVGRDLATEQQQEERKTKRLPFIIAKKLSTVRHILIFRNAKM